MLVGGGQYCTAGGYQVIDALRLLLATMRFFRVNHLHAFVGLGLTKL